MSRSEHEPDMREFLDFLREVSRYLISCGCSSHRVELLTKKLGASWGFEIETMALPTGVWISVRKYGINLIDLTRVSEWTVDLDRLARLNELVESMDKHNITIRQAYEAIKTEANAQPPYGKALTVLAGGATSATLLYAYGGTWLEMTFAFPMGMLTQFLHKYALVATDHRRHVNDLVSAAVVALCAVVAHHFFTQIDVPKLIVGGIIGLVPGLILTNAIHEVAQKNLVSGAAKCLEAFVIAASLGCGVLAVLGLAILFNFE